VIERPISDRFDFDGWDIRKALKLFAKSNPPLLEWLDSSIVYLDQFSFAERLRALRAAFFYPQACAYHYLHMAQGNYRTYLRGATVWLKKYFYVLRPLLAVRWIEQKRGVVPMLFSDLLETVCDQMQLHHEIQDLLQRKMAGDELDEGPAIPAIQEFINSELSRMETLKFEHEKPRVDN
jgi:predicted nucleotidyltransferase